MSYRAYYAMLLPVEGMMDAGGVGFNPEKAAAALRKMAAHIEANPQELVNILGKSPVHAEQEDRWVLSAASQKNIIRNAAGEWVEVKPRMIDLKDTASSDVISAGGFQLNEEMVWRRPENISGTPVIARIEGPDGNFLGQIDLADWIAEADDEDLSRAILNDWDFSEAIHEAREDQSIALEDDPNFLPADRAGSTYKVLVGTEDIDRAIAYIEELKPEFLQEIGFYDAEKLRPEA